MTCFAKTIMNIRPYCASYVPSNGSVPVCDEFEIKCKESNLPCFNLPYHKLPD
jgi:hypothetical protein